MHYTVVLFFFYIFFSPSSSVACSTISFWVDPLSGLMGCSGARLFIKNDIIWFASNESWLHAKMIYKWKEIRRFIIFWSALCSRLWCAVRCVLYVDLQWHRIKLFFFLRSYYLLFSLAHAFRREKKTHTSRARECTHRNSIHGRTIKTNST